MHLDPTYLAHLRRLPEIAAYQVVTATPESDLAWDAALDLHTTGGAIRLLVLEYRSHLGHETADLLVQRAPQIGSPVLLLAPHIGKRLAAKLAASGLNYLDRSGNCHIAVDGLYIHVEGRTPPARPAAERGIRAAGYQVLFAYLAEPGLLDASMRAVARMAGVSTQPVYDMKHRLLGLEYIVETKSATRWVSRRRTDALSLWLHGYATTVRPSLVRGSYRTRDASPTALEERLLSVFEATGVSEYRWGGTAAGFRLTEYYRGPRTTVHVHATPGDFQRRMKAATATDGNLVVMSAFGELNWQPEAKTVHPLLVYSEMLSDRDERAHEAAQVLFEQHIEPTWSARQ